MLRHELLCTFDMILLYQPGTILHCNRILYWFWIKPQRYIIKCILRKKRKHTHTQSNKYNNSHPSFDSFVFLFILCSWYTSQNRSFWFNCTEWHFLVVIFSTTLKLLIIFVDIWMADSSIDWQCFLFCWFHWQSIIAHIFLTWF